MMKKICALLALTMMLTCAALAETPATPTFDCDDFTYIVLGDGTAQIVDWMGQDEDLTVPAELDGRAVTSISECAFCDCRTLQTISLPNTVTEIGEEAFSGCESLMSVALPEGLERIGDMCFKGCEGLTQIALPDSVNSIGVNPFLACDNLYDISVSPDNAYLAAINGALITKSDKCLISYPIGLSAERYTVPEGIRIIGARAFGRNLYLEEVVLPETLVRIEGQAFNGCSGLRAMKVPAGVTSIGEGAMPSGSRTLSVEAEDGVVQYALAEGSSGEGI